MTAVGLYMGKKIFVFCCLFFHAAFFACCFIYAQESANDTDKKTDNINVQITIPSSKENSNAMSLDGNALNKMIPVLEKTEPPKDEKRKETPENPNKKPAKQKKENKSVKPQEMPQSEPDNKTVIPRMKSVKWIHNIIGGDDASPKRIVFYPAKKKETNSHPAEKPKPDKPWHDGCGRPICVPDVWHEDSKAITQPGKRKCCQIYIYKNGQITNWHSR